MWLMEWLASGRAGRDLLPSPLRPKVSVCPVFKHEPAEVYRCTLSSSLQVSPLQKCEVVSEIKLERERCENSTAGNITSGLSTSLALPF